MTRKQLETLDTIKKFQSKFGYSPSMEELRVALGLASKSMVHRLLKGLEERGYIRRLRNRARAIEIVANPTLPKDLSQFSISDLAREAHRRGLVIGQIITEHHHRHGINDPVVSRKFKEIQPEEG